jgi:hypothetical protein
MNDEQRAVASSENRYIQWRAIARESQHEHSIITV